MLDHKLPRQFPYPVYPLLRRDLLEGVGRQFTVGEIQVGEGESRGEILLERREHLLGLFVAKTVARQIQVGQIRGAAPQKCPEDLVEERNGETLNPR